MLFSALLVPKTGRQKYRDYEFYRAYDGKLVAKGRWQDSGAKKKPPAKERFILRYMSVGRLQIESKRQHGKAREGKGRGTVLRFFDNTKKHTSRLTGGTMHGAKEQHVRRCVSESLGTTKLPFCCMAGSNVCPQEPPDAGGSSLGTAPAPGSRVFKVEDLIMRRMKATRHECLNAYPSGRSACARGRGEATARLKRVDLPVLA